MLLAGLSHYVSVPLNSSDSRDTLSPLRTNTHVQHPLLYVHAASIRDVTLSAILDVRPSRPKRTNEGTAAKFPRSVRDVLLQSSPELTSVNF